jgi:apolipoprotein N-acyltransferase
MSALILVCAFPPVKIGFLAYGALIPLLIVVEHAGLKRSFLWSYLTGLVFLGISLFWIRHITWIGMVSAVVVLAVFFALPFLVIGMVRGYGGLFLFPFAVAGVEWIRSFDQLAFPWMALGNSQTSYPWLIQFADITSVYGVSCWIAFINVIIFLLIRRRTLVWAVFLSIFILVPFLYSWMVMRGAECSGREMTVALVQGNVLPDEKWEDDLELWNLDLYMTMTREAMAFKPDLIIWPETAIPFYLLDNRWYRSYQHTLHAFVDSIDVPILSGIPSYDSSSQEKYNSAGLFVPGERKVKRYHKIHLVPCGEAFPMDSLFPKLRDIDLGQANWEEGTEVVDFQPPRVPPFNVAICFESIFPDLIRKFIERGSQFIVVITNDVWFGPYASPIQHAMISVMRAIEFHRPVVRCANTGISMIIDPYGRIIKQTKTFERTILTGTITPCSYKSFYLRYGNIFGLFSFIISLAVVIYYFINRFRPARGKL